MLWHGGLCGCLPIFALVSDRPECKRVSSSPAVNFSRSLSFTRLSPHGIPCQRERRVRWVCGRTGQRLREMTGSVIRAARGVPYRGGGGGGCLQRDTSAAASVVAVSCQCLRFYGTFTAICHSFNGVVCASCHLPPCHPRCPPSRAHTRWGAQPYGAERAALRVLFFWVRLEGLLGSVAR